MSCEEWIKHEIKCILCDIRKLEEKLAKKYKRLRELKQEGYPEEWFDVL